MAMCLTVIIFLIETLAVFFLITSSKDTRLLTVGGAVILLYRCDI